MLQVLICHLFYLPYEHGPRATAMLQSVAWLLDYYVICLVRMLHLSERCYRC